MQKWEYRVTGVMGTDLTALGEAGWELVHGDGTTLFFKRPITDAPAQPVAIEQQPDNAVATADTPNASDTAETETANAS